MTFPRKKPMRRSQPKRDWSEAEKKRGRCRVCGHRYTELAHTYSRFAQDELVVGPRGGEVLKVKAVSVVPLCKEWMPGDYPGNFIPYAGCHKLYDQHKLDLLPHLTLEEQLEVVRAAGNLVTALRRVSGRAAA